jgi:hypothetical protein
MSFDQKLSKNFTICGRFAETYLIANLSMLSDEMSIVKENETMVSRQAPQAIKPGAHLANPVRASSDIEFCLKGRTN